MADPRGLPRFTPLVLVALAGCAAEAAAPPVAADYAIEGVAVLPMDGSPALEGQTVLIEGDRIVAMGAGAQVSVPEGATRIDGSGRWLMPGLAEMHAHVPGGNAPRQLLEDILFLYVANGITTIRGMLGAPEQLGWREEIASGALLGPTFLVGAPSLNGNTAPTPADAERLIREHAAAGYDFQKIHPGVPLDAWNRMVEVAREVGFTYGGHVPEDVGLEHALQTGIATVDHMDGFLQAAIPEDVQRRFAAELGVIPTARILDAVDETRLRELVQRTREEGAWVVPTSYLWENFYRPLDPDSMLALPEMRYVPASMRQGWVRQKAGMPAESAAVGEQMAQVRLDLLRMLHEAGVPLLMGTDSPQMFNVPGFALHHEMRLMEQVMSPEDVLVTGTRNVGDYVGRSLGGDGAFGTVATGQRADLLLLEADPRETVANVTRMAGVFVRGRWIPEQEIAQQLERIGERYAP